MKMGTMATVGSLSPSNLVHICFDNHQYESTGGQRSVSREIDFSKIAGGCGYRSAESVISLGHFKILLPKILLQDGPHFVHVGIRAGTISKASRPDESPEKLKWDSC